MLILFLKTTAEHTVWPCYDCQLDNELRNPNSILIWGKIIMYRKPCEVYMRDEVLTKSIVHTIWLDSLFSDGTVNSLQVIDFNGVNWLAKIANYWESYDLQIPRTCSRGHSNTYKIVEQVQCTKFDHILNSSCGRKYKFKRC